ncbi:MAG: hypothetical protein ABI718_09310 [Acidobacteriota bacterium]
MKFVAICGLLLAVNSSLSGQGPERTPKTATEAQREMDAVWRREHSASTLRNTALHSAALKEALREFQNGDTPFGGKGSVSFGEFLSPSGQYFVAVHLALPALPEVRPGMAATLFGTVERNDGTLAASFEEKAQVAESRGQLYLEKSLALPPGDYKATFGVAIGARPVVIERIDLDALPRSLIHASISRLILSRDVQVMSESQEPTEPFAFGGTRVVPLGTTALNPSEPLWIFVEIFNPALAPDGTPRIQMKYEILQAGSRRAGAPMVPVEATALKGFPAHYGIGDTIDVSRLAPSRYDISVTVSDKVTGQSWSLAGDFRIGSATPPDL